VTVYQCGIWRSGSTFIWQVMRDLLPDHDVLKVHPYGHGWKPDGSPIVATYRDPRDVLASCYRVKLSRDGKLVGTPDDLLTEVNNLARVWEAFEPIAKRPETLTLRYEWFTAHPDNAVDAIAARFGVSVTPERRRKILEARSVEANLKIAATLGSFLEIDADTQIHGEHICGKTWRDVLPEWAHETAIESTAALCRKWGYQ